MSKRPNTSHPRRDGSSAQLKTPAPPIYSGAVQDQVPYDGAIVAKQRKVFGQLMTKPRKQP